MDKQQDYSFCSEHPVVVKQDYYTGCGIHISLFAPTHPYVTGQGDPGHKIMRIRGGNNSWAVFKPDCRQHATIFIPPSHALALCRAVRDYTDGTDIGKDHEAMIEGKLVATEHHLKDMRRLVFEEPKAVIQEGTDGL